MLYHRMVNSFAIVFPDPKHLVAIDILLLTNIKVEL